MSSGPEFRAIWESLLAEYNDRLERRRQLGEKAWNGVRSRLDSVNDELEASEERKLEPDKLASIRTCFRDFAKPLLVTPVNAHNRAAPQQSTLTAITEFRNGMDDVARRLPDTIEVSGQERAVVLRPLTPRDPRRQWLRFQSAPKPFLLRTAVMAHLEQDELRRSHLDGAFHLLLAQASLHLAGPWHIVRQRGLDFLEDGVEVPAKMSKARARWRRRWSQLLQTAEGLHEANGRWYREAPKRLAKALLAHTNKDRQSESERRQERLTRYFAYWSRQQRATQAVLNLELELAGLAVQITDIVDGALRSLDAEHASLLEELESVIQWLVESNDAREPGPWPPQRADLVSADARINNLHKEIAEVGRRKLPESLETVDPRSPLPGRRSPWRTLEPEAIFLRVLAGAREQRSIEGLREAETAHRAILRELERAREVVAYGQETIQQEGDEGRKVAAESTANALALLRYHQQNAPPVHGTAERGLTRGIAAGFLECYIALDQGRLGLLTHLVQESSERGLRRVWGIGVGHARRGAIAAWRWMESAWAGLLVSLGLKAPPSPPMEAVSRVSRLDYLLELRIVRPELPLLYRRLFRLDPVVDPRYLVGRDEEMAGLVEARVQWLTGKPVSVLLVGARGSGKTSLLNCTAQIAFDGLPQTRIQFRERILDPSAMDRFLLEQLELPASGDTCETLRASRRVVMLEEVERTFLRKINGFSAMRHLLDIISATWNEVLWVLSLNATAHRYLNLVTRIDRFFTHRVNAMAVRIEDIREAILLRHNLSGYRLTFPPPPQRKWHIGEVRRRLGIEPDPADVFFETLYQQSGGIFRAAFELWRHQIERIEGGVVHLRSPVEPDYTPLLRALSADDCMSLQAILQHGGLTASELAEVFGESETAGLNRLERLLGFEILEPDPAGPGLRVRPEAGALVREALHRRNLR